MAITAKGLKLLAIGLLVMIAGFILMMGGGSDDPNVFNTDMFDFQIWPIFNIADISADFEACIMIISLVCTA